MKKRSELGKNLAITLITPLLAHTSAWAATKGEAPSFFGSLIPLDGIALLSRDETVGALLRGGEHTVEFSKRIQGEDLTTSRYQGYYRGIEVIGSEALIHSSGWSQREVSDELARVEVSTSPTVTKGEAISIAQSALEGRELESMPRLKILPSDDGSSQLVYWVSLKNRDLAPGADFIVNAHNGELVAQISHHYTIGASTVAVEVFDGSDGKISESDGYSVDPSACQVMYQGMPVAIQPENCGHVVTRGVAQGKADQTARRAAQNAQKTLNYYASTHKRSSFDGQGSAAVNIVHVGKDFDNAFWDSEHKIMAYGDGDGEQFYDFTLAVDVAAHEMTHGVTSETANLLYMGESGAVNEASSDFFGKMVANDGDWIMGKEIMVNHEGIRDLAAPGSKTVRMRDDRGVVQTKPYPDHMSKAFKTSRTCDGSNDHCFVHINSTIFGHALYNVVQSVGRDKAQKMYFLALTQMMTARSGFKSARDATLKACKKLYDKKTCGQAQSAFASVGL